MKKPRTSLWLLLLLFPWSACRCSGCGADEELVSRPCVGFDDRGNCIPPRCQGMYFLEGTHFEMAVGDGKYVVCEPESKPPIGDFGW